jgi:hypothetical protein
MELVKQLRDKLPLAEYVEALSIARLIWMRRNKLIFNNQFSHPALVPV